MTLQRAVILTSVSNRSTCRKTNWVVTRPVTCRISASISTRTYQIKYNCTLAGWTAQCSMLLTRHHSPLVLQHCHRSCSIRKHVCAARRHRGSISNQEREEQATRQHSLHAHLHWVQKSLAKALASAACLGVLLQVTSLPECMTVTQSILTYAL